MWRMLSVVVLLATGCETAGAPGAAAGSTETKSVASTERPTASKQVCRNVKVTGSRMPVKDCKTPEEWERADDGGQGLDRPEVQPK